MSGHSKWSTIKRQKEVKDQKKGATFTKLARGISVAAKEGGGEMATNFKLRLAVDLAKAASMPKDNIERAIKRGTGELQGEIIETVVYEAIGPNDVALIIEAVTDNRNRTVNDIKLILNKNGGRYGAVMWMFDRRGMIEVSGKTLDELQLIDAGADDVILAENSAMVFTAPENLMRVTENLEKAGLIVSSSTIGYWPKTGVTYPEGAMAEKLDKLLDLLDENDDVARVFTNAVL